MILILDDSEPKKVQLTTNMRDIVWKETRHCPLRKAACKMFAVILPKNSWEGVLFGQHCARNAIAAL